MLRKIILDNTVFNRFVWLHSVELFQMLLNMGLEQVLVPEKVKDELQVFAGGTPHAAPRLNSWLNAIRPNGFFHLCTTVDNIVFALISDKLDEGEAHALAQSTATSVGIFITDDFRIPEQLTQIGNYPKTYSSYFLLAYADVIGFLAEKQYQGAFIEMMLDMRFGDFTPRKKKEYRPSAGEVNTLPHCATSHCPLTRN